ncbi:hypothetical protein Angca_004393 [Angiostrongylus cantonensis]|nr:hypothetical protein Angca_004393 [Angiostrongylus cantonensis]
MNKKGLGPLVECSEGVDGADQDVTARGIQVDGNASCSKGLVRPDVQTSRSSEAVSTRRKNKGSRLSLTSLFSIASFSGQGKQNRERPHSGWSCEESTVAMSSASTTDLHSESGSIGPNRRNRGSDIDLCQDEGSGDQCSYLLLADDYEGEDECLELMGKKKQSRGSRIRECPLCCMRQPQSNFPRLICCQHRSCRLCLMQYVEMEIMENRVEVSCPECAAHLHPSDIRNLVGGRTALIEKYEQFSLRRYLMTEADARWCPAPDCGYAVIASSCAACPQLKCERESCGTLFCYHCKGVWHASQTCDEARRQRGAPSFRATRRITSASIDIQLKPGDIKACPRCHTYIVKMDDGSCNHMVCAMCSVEFCWLCLKEISDLHYLSPTGCTFWGKKPWTRKKKLLWQLGTLIGAPVGIALIAGLSIPGIIFGVPVFVGRKVHQRFLHHSKTRRRLLTAACVAGSLFVSPVLAVMAVGVGVPIMLAYVYGVVPLSLCRNGGCGFSEANGRPGELDEEDLWAGTSSQDRSHLLGEVDKHPDGSSLVAGLSMQSGISGGTQHHVRLAVNHDIRRRPSVESGVNSLGERFNYEEASTRAMAGSHYHCDDKSVHTLYSGHEIVSYSDEVASTKALAGSVLDSKSLSESLGARALAFQHEHGCEGSHTCACATPSTSSAEHNKPHVDEPSTVNMPRKRSDRIRLVVAYPPTEDFEQALLLGEESGPLGQSYASGSDPHPSTSSMLTHHDSREEVDPFKIRTLLDNMKQMVAADQPIDRPYEPAGSARSAPAPRFLRSGSGRSISTLATQSHEPGVGAVAQSKHRRGILQSLFSSERRRRK